MAILKVARMGHPVLRTPTKDMSKEELLAPETQRLVDDMIVTMHEYEGVGLAAPQVHASKRLLIAEYQVDSARPSRDMPVIPLTVLFNFRIVAAGKETNDDWEGCLSLPGLRGLVPRHNTIEVTALDRHANPMRFKASGFFARILQHEGDHLDGVLFPERMRDLKQLAFVEEFHRFGLDETAE